MYSRSIHTFLSLQESMWNLAAFFLFISCTATTLDNMTTEDKDKTKQLIIFKTSVNTATGLLYLMDLFLEIVKYNMAQI